MPDYAEIVCFIPERDRDGNVKPGGRRFKRTLGRATGLGTDKVRLYIESIPVGFDGSAVVQPKQDRGSGGGGYRQDAGGDDDIPFG